MEENKEEVKTEKTKKDGFFKKVWYSVTKIEKYPDMAAEGVGRALTYLLKLIVCLSIIMVLSTLYQTYNLMQDAISYIQNDFPNFSYENGILTVESQEPITIEETVFGEILVNTNTQNQEEIDSYINSLKEKGQGFIVLKDSVIIKNQLTEEPTTYKYKDILSTVNINAFTKQDMTNYINSKDMKNVYMAIFGTTFIYAFIYTFIINLLNLITDVVMLSLIGLITAWVARIIIRYAAIFNLSVYSLTLSVILNMIYIAINIFIDFEIEYFQVMYVAVAAIYLIATIFILKTEFIKKQRELMKIEEAQAIVRKQLEEDEEEKQREKEREERKKKDKEEEEKEKNKKPEEKDKKEKSGNNKEKKDGGLGQTPQGSNA